MSQTHKCPIHFDHNSPEFVEERYETYEKLRTTCPVHHEDAYDGFYVLSRYDDVLKAARDPKTYSSSAADKDPPNPPKGRRVGVLVPPSPTVVTVIEMDPPESTELRKLLQPWFIQSNVDAYLPNIVRHAELAMDSVIEAGECDLVQDLARVVPARAVVEYIGVSVDHAERIAEYLHKLHYIAVSDPEYKSAVLDGHAWIHDTIVAEVEEHQRSPREGTMITALLRDVSPEEVIELTFLLLHGGNDTVHSVVSNALVYLDENPADRQRLIADRSLLPSAVEEWLRFFSPATGLARTVTKETELHGVPLEEGDRVILSYSSANRDQEQFPQADQVQLDRSPNAHVAFGVGAHRCVGARFAKAEAITIMDTVLERMPDYRIDRGGVERFPSVGVSNGFISIPASFTPGPRTMDQKEDY